MDLAISDLDVTIGIIGGGQLARMSAQAAQRMGQRVVILDSDPNCSAGQVTSAQIVLDWNSADGTAELARQSSIITLENEWANPELLNEAEKLGTPVLPAPGTLFIVGDKLVQRMVIANRGLPSPRYRALSQWSDVAEAAEDWGGKVVLKSRHGGYDGYGVRILQTPIDQATLPESDAAEWYVEEFVPFERELAIIVSKNSSGETAAYPVVESRQTEDGHRCDVVIAPAPGLSSAEVAQVKQIALNAIDAVGGIGLFGVELFASDGQFIVNEIAPRPHNSGHYTMDGCATSQFEQHIRAILNWKPGKTDLLAPAIVMLNLLAPRDGRIDLRHAIDSAIATCPEVKVHWYGKSQIRRGRKLGHLNLFGFDQAAVIEKGLAARDAFWKGLL